MPLWENWIRDIYEVTEKTKGFTTMTYDTCALSRHCEILWGYYGEFLFVVAGEIRFDGGKGIGLRRCRLDWYVSSSLFNSFRRLTMSFLWWWREIGSLFCQTMAGNQVQDVKNFALLIYFP